MYPILERLKERKLVQWAVAYLAGAWLLEQLADTLGSRWGMTDAAARGLDVLLVVGFFVTIAVAWYHGEKARQRVSGAELLIIAALMGLGGIGLGLVAPGSDGDDGSGRAILDPPGGSTQPGIAVLPFETLTPGDDARAFSEGLQIELINTLQRSTGEALKVIARQAVLPYRDLTVSSDSIGRALGVEHLVYGSLQRGGDQVLLSLELIEARSGSQLWSEQLQSSFAPGAILDLQADVVSRIAGVLQIALRRQELVTRASQTQDERAFDLFLRAAASNTQSAALLEEALEIDPDFLMAHARLSRLLSSSWQYSGNRTPQVDSLSLWHAERALELDAASPDAQMAMAWYLYRTKRWDEVAPLLERVRPTLGSQRDYLIISGSTARRLGRFDRALAIGERVVELDPGTNQNSQLAGTLFMLRRYDEAIAQYEVDGARPDWLAVARWQQSGDLEDLRVASRSTDARWLTWDAALYESDWEGALALLRELPERRVKRGLRWWPAAMLEGWALEGAGRVAEARTAYERAEEFLRARVSLAPQDARAIGALGLVLALLDEPVEALETVGRAVDMSPRVYDSLEGPYRLWELAAVQARLGMTAEAIATLESLLSAPAYLAPREVENDYMLRTLRADSRFRALMDEHRERVF